MLTSSRGEKGATRKSLWWKIQTALENHEFQGVVCTQPTTSRRDGLVVFLLMCRPIKRNGSEIPKSLTEKLSISVQRWPSTKKVFDLFKSYTISIWKVFWAAEMQREELRSWRLVRTGKPSLNQSNNRLTLFYCTTADASSGSAWQTILSLSCSHSFSFYIHFIPSIHTFNFPLWLLCS